MFCLIFWRVHGCQWVNAPYIGCVLKSMLSSFQIGYPDYPHRRCPRPLELQTLWRSWISFLFKHRPSVPKKKIILNYSSKYFVQVHYFESFSWNNLKYVFFCILYLPVSFGWFPKIIQYFYLNLPGFFLLFFLKKWRTIIQYLPYYFRWLPTSYCLTPENPVSSLQVADAVRYVHAQKMVHRATWMITCICLMCFFTTVPW